MKFDIFQNSEELKGAVEQFCRPEVREQFSSFSMFLTDGVLQADGTLCRVSGKGDHAALYHRFQRNFSYTRIKQRRASGVEPGEIATDGLAFMEYSLRILISDGALRQKMQAVIAVPPLISKEFCGPVSVLWAPNARPGCAPISIEMDAKTKIMVLRACMNWVLIPGVQARYPRFDSRFLRNCKIVGSTFVHKTEDGTHTNLYNRFCMYGKILGIQPNAAIALALRSLGGLDIVRAKIRAQYASTGPTPPAPASAAAPISTDDTLLRSRQARMSICQDISRRDGSTLPPRPNPTQRAPLKKRALLNTS